MTMRSISFLLATAALLALPATAGAAETYVEAVGGLSRGDIDCAGTVRCDRSSSFGRLSVGHTLAPGWAVEFSLGQWGTLEAAGDVPGFGRVEARIRARGVGLGLATAMPLASDWVLSARLGASSNTARVTGRALGGSTTSSERSTAPYAGVGLAYKFSDAMSLGLQVDTTRVEAEGEKATITMAGASLRYAF